MLIKNIMQKVCAIIVTTNMAEKATQMHVRMLTDYPTPKASAKIAISMTITKRCEKIRGPPKY